MLSLLFKFSRHRQSVRVKIVKDIDRVYELTNRQKAVFSYLQAAHAQDFLLAILVEGLGQKMSSLEYRTILKYRLMIPFYQTDTQCPTCIRGCLDAFGEHAIHCKVDPCFKKIHDRVRDTLYDMLWRAGISVKKEATVNFFTDPLEGRSTLRPVDVLIFGWVNGKHACVDLTGVSLLVGMGYGTVTVGLAALRAISGKITKHEKACQDNGHVFIPFAFDTFHFLAPDAVGLLKRVQKVMHNNVMTPGSREFVFRRIGFAVQKYWRCNLLPAYLLH